MLIAISSQKPESDSLVDTRFGRAQYFMIWNTESRKWEAHANPAVGQSGGAGVAAAQFMIDHNVNAVLSGDFGPNANQALGAANIEMSLFTAEVDTVQSALELFRNGKLKHFG